MQHIRQRINTSLSAYKLAQLIILTSFSLRYNNSPTRSIKAKVAYSCTPKKRACLAKLGHCFKYSKSGYIACDLNALYANKDSTLLKYIVELAAYNFAIKEEVLYNNLVNSNSYKIAAKGKQSKSKLLN